MLRANDLSIDSLLYRRLTEVQLDKLHQATLEVLVDAGIRFAEPEALEIFKKGGAYVDGSLVRIPVHLVEWALRTAPKHLTLYDQVGEPAIHLNGRVSYFGNGSDLLYIIDHRTGERRLPELQDVVDNTRVLNKLDNINFIMSGFLPRDVPVDKAAS